jgi:hypothetical protein
MTSSQRWYFYTCNQASAVTDCHAANLNVNLENAEEEFCVARFALLEGGLEQAVIVCRAQGWKAGRSRFVLIQEG